MTINSDQRLRLTLRQLEVFAATVRSGSTRGAADKVARSQSAASAALADLETTLGAVLFDRVGRRLVLNQNGKALLPRAVALLERAAEAEACLRVELEAPLRIASSMTVGEYMLPQLIAGWHQDHPRGRIRLDVVNTKEVLRAVAAYDADVGFIEGTGSHPDLVVSRWRSDELVPFTATDHALARGHATEQQLAHATWVLREPGSGTREMSDRWLTSHLGEVEVGIELGSNEAVKRAVASGLGVGFLSRLAIADALRHGWLSELQTPYPPMRRLLAVVTHRSKQPVATALAFVSHCRALGG